MGKPPKPAGSRFGQFCCQKFLDPCKLRITLSVALVHNFVPDHWTARQSRLNLVCHTAVFSVVTQRTCHMWGGALRDDTKKGCVAD